MDGHADRARLVRERPRHRLTNPPGRVRYDDPLKRLARERYRDNGAVYTPQEQARFAAWLDSLGGDVDVVMVHAPALARQALDVLRAAPPAAPLLLVAGHTHAPALERFGPLTLLNPGSVGGGGTGNLADADADADIGLARLTYAATPSFLPRAADLVQIDPGDGEAQARRVRLDAAA